MASVGGAVSRIKRGAKKVKLRLSVERRVRDGFIELIPELASYKKETFEELDDLAKKRGCSSLKSYYSLLQSSQAERDYLRKNLTLLGSHFFRGSMWDFFHDECLSTFAGKTGIEVWCTGCSSGQEVYSTIVMLLDYVSLDDISVLATDYNDDQLAKCEAGSYFNMHLWEVPEKYRCYLDYGEERFTFKDEIRSVVHTGIINLVSDEYPGPFDIIVCRNVIKFFSPEARTETKRRLVSSLKPGGYLFVSTDDNHGGAELIEDPAAFGVVEIGEGCGIYRKL